MDGTEEKVNCQKSNNGETENLEVDSVPGAASAGWQTELQNLPTAFCSQEKHEHADLGSGDTDDDGTTPQ